MEDDRSQSSPIDYAALATDWGPALVGTGVSPGTARGTASVYVPTAIETFGRRMKLEYIGMISVYLIIGVLVFGGTNHWFQALIGAIGAFLVFLGIKKKTRDHLSGSLILFASTLLAQGAVVDLGWSISYLGFASCVCAMEGYLEKRQEQALALPVIFILWIFVDLSWIPALVFVASYLLFPWAQRPGLRKRLVWLVGLSALVAIGGFAIELGISPQWTTALGERAPLDPTQQLLLVSMGLPTILCLGAYWRRLIPTHRLNTLIFATLAPFDERLLGMFGMVAAITLSATAFRHSIDSDAMRPLFKHAEWFYFWVVFGVAIWAIVAT